MVNPNPALLLVQKLKSASRALHLEIKASEKRTSQSAPSY